MNAATVRHRIRLMRWLWLRNTRARIAFLRARRPLDSGAEGILRELLTDGISVRADVGDPGLFADLLYDAQQRFAAAWDGKQIRPQAADWKKDRSNLPVHEKKDFLLRLISPTLDADSVYLRYALQEEFLAVADSYLGLEAELRAVDLWLNYPTGGEARSTQLWHKDADDLVNLKVFTYLSDVDESSGPFAYAPGTHPFGEDSSLVPQSRIPGRIEDGDMERKVSRDHWRICTGRCGTSVFADTCGLHKGVKPVARPRLMLMCHYTSPASYTGKELAIRGSLEGKYTKRQARAVASSVQ